MVGPNDTDNCLFTALRLTALPLALAALLLAVVTGAVGRVTRGGICRWCGLPYSGTACPDCSRRGTGEWVQP